MPRPTIPPAVIAQRGQKITLLDGREVPVVFTFSSLMRLEEDFGSIGGALEAVQAGEGGQAFTALARIIASGLEHERDDEANMPLSDVDTLRALLDPMRFADYSDALGEGLKSAFPSLVTDAGGEDGEETADPTPPSRGTSGTTSPPSPSGAPKRSSGG